MKRLLIGVYSVCVAASLIAVRADDTSTSKTTTSTSSTTAKHNKGLTDDQKTLRKEMLDKYDSNHDGKIDKEERKKVTDEDKAKLKKAGLNPKAQKKLKSTTTTTTSTTTSPGSSATSSTK
jgi:hypothetical protein